MTRPSPRTDLAHEALKQAILERALQPGTKLPEDDIGSHFAMSRTLVPGDIWNALLKTAIGVQV